MDELSYQKLKTRLSGAIHNAIIKDPDISYKSLHSAFHDVCHRFLSKDKLKME